MQPSFAPGDRIGGKYVVLSVIGEGGMGVVLAARHEVLEMRVAVKLLRDASTDERATTRFLREARAAAQLRGEHTVRVHDFGTDRGTAYLVMELLDGVSWKAALAAGPIAATRAVDHALDVCIALAEGHALGIVHRDVKPSNVFLARRPDGTTRACLVDYGIAKPLAIDVTLTENDTSLGTPQYMAPEQIRDARRVDARADLWSLGVVLYEALSGVLPFEAATPAGYLASVAADAPIPLATRVATLPAGLAAVVDRCLAKDPARRFASAAELAAALAPFGGADAEGRAAQAARVAAEVARREPAAMPAAPAPPRDPETVTGTRQEWATHPEPTPTPPPRRRGTTVALLVGAAALAVAVVVVVSPTRDARTARTTEPTASTLPVAPAAPAVPLASTSAIAAAQAEPTATIAPPPSASTTRTAERAPERIAAPKPRPTTPPPAAGGTIELTDFGGRK